MTVRLLVGDCREHMLGLAAASVDAVVTDPPYGLEFMGQGWDRGVPGLDFWFCMKRVLKPGGHLLAFGGPRTFHRMAVAIEDAGFEIRDCLSWLYGSGFPKSLDVSKALDKAAGAERRLTRPGIVQRNGYGDDWDTGSSESQPRYDQPATDLARQWDGWGTALKPAWEPIILARKPLVGTVAANVTAHGTGALNIDGCRIEGDVPTTVHGVSSRQGEVYGTFRNEPQPFTPNASGRWPANVVLDEDAAAALDAQSGERRSAGDYPTTYSNSDGMFGGIGKQQGPLYSDSGGASRFFYTAKASTAERNKGLYGVPESFVDDGRQTPIDNPFLRGVPPRRNIHPTVKPLDLMQWLVRLVTPPGGTVLDPFMGSGTTGIAADREGFDFIGIEQDPEYARIAELRIRGDAPLFANLSTA